MAGVMKQIQQSLRQAFSPESKESRVERVKALKGKYAFVRTSSEEFSRQKQIEIQREG